MKVILQGFEPQARIAIRAIPAAVHVRKPRLSLNAVTTDFRLFHAL
jgi:hypothetical protein